MIFTVYTIKIYTVGSKYKHLYEAEVSLNKAGVGLREREKWGFKKKFNSDASAANKSSPCY